MSELKAYDHEFRPNEYGKFYLKSEADAYIRKLDNYHKYKRCLDRVELCDSRIFYYGKLVSEVVNLDLENERRVKVFKRFNFYKRWYRRWRELAEKFKEAKQ